MRILHVYKDYHPVRGGIEHHVRWLAERQADAGHDVTVLACAPGWRSTSTVLNGVRVEKAGRLFTAASMPLSMRQPLMLRSMTADIVHVQSPYPLGEVANWLLGRGRGTVITYQSDIVRQRRLNRLYRPLQRRLLAAADRIIATSPPYIDTSPMLSVLRDMCTVIPNGIDVDRFAPAGTVHSKARDESSDRPLRLLFVGRLRYYKGLDVLLQALAQAPEAHATIVGGGPMAADLKSLAARLGLGERVSFTGDVGDADLPGFYEAADVFVLPSSLRAEAFGLVLLEAMAAGLPCVATELGTGTSWIVQHGETGLVVPPDDPAALAAAIRALGADPSARAGYGRRGRERVERVFALDVVVPRVLALYEEVLSSGGRDARGLRTA